jgi:hypothetical protein
MLFKHRKWQLLGLTKQTPQVNQTWEIMDFQKRREIHMIRQVSQRLVECGKLVASPHVEKIVDLHFWSFSCTCLVDTTP